MSAPHQSLLNNLADVYNQLDKDPYDVASYQNAAALYNALGYPDLAAGAAYKALLLLDAVEDESDERHEDAVNAFRSSFAPHIHYKDGQPQDDGEDSTDLAISKHIKHVVKPSVYIQIAQALLACRCLFSAYKYSKLGLDLVPDSEHLLMINQNIQSLAQELGHSTTPEDWPDSTLVRRECYPWNAIEPDRFSSDSLVAINAAMAKAAPKLIVQAVELPVLGGDNAKAHVTVKQLGVFAREELKPGEIILSESSLLTATNRLGDAICDACGTEITSGNAGNDTSVICDDCQAFFCTQDCLDQANEAYHPAICDKDVDSIAKEVPAAQAADSLYLLLLLRSFAMAETQNIHPLEIKEVKYIWGDYTNISPNKHETSNYLSTLPFNMDSNIVLPYLMLTKMGVNIFTEHRRYDTWVFNTLFAKFRGTASARLSGSEESSHSRPSTGYVRLTRARGPDVSAVHPCWCLANHSCDPNVEWEWGGKIQFKVREKRKEWKRYTEGQALDEIVGPLKPGIKKGEEILGHYCDIDLDVTQRREWAAGALGGKCRCDRCVWESKE